MDDKKRAWYLDQVQRFKAYEMSNYEIYAKVLERLLQKVVDTLGIMALVQTRPKSLASFAEKCLRKYDKYKDPVSQLTDLCGGRVVTYTQADAVAVCRFVEDNFKVDEANSLDLATRLKTSEFGYRACHYVVVMDSKPLLGVDIPLALEGRKAEIQICTFLQHTWAAIGHDRLYKGNVKAPKHIEREVHRVAALLETSDAEFERATDGLDAYIKNFDAYMSPGQIRDEIDKWEAVRQCDRRSATAVLKIAHLARALESWEQIIESIARFRKDEGKMNSPLWRELGHAECRLGRATHDHGRDDKLVRSGRTHLEEAIKSCPDDALVYCELADSWFDEFIMQGGCQGGPQETKDEALKNYELAFKAAPTDPHILQAYLRCKICTEREAAFLPLLRGSLLGAIEECERRIELSVYLPDAFYDMGMFHLFLELEAPYTSLGAFAKAVHRSSDVRPIEQALQSITWIQTALGEKAPVGLEWVRRFLALAIPGKLLVVERSRERTLEKAEWELLDAEEDRATLAGAQFKPRPADLAKAEQRVEERRAKLAEAREKLAAAKARARAGLADAGLAALATSPRPRACAGPVVIVAGSCDPNEDKKIRTDYGELLTSGFKGFLGTIISGGTTSGVSGMVGDLKFANGVCKIAYLPEDPLPQGDQRHPGYDQPPRRVPGSGYTALGPIQTWADLLLQGHKPWEVRILGINGGWLSAFEYWLGVAVGAVVGIVESSGRKASELLREAEQYEMENLLVLPNDPMTLRAYVGAPASSTNLKDAEEVNTVAREVHSNYLRENDSNAKKMHPSMRRWEKLRNEYKDSNRQQALYAEKILAAEGYVVERAKLGEAIVLPEFSDEEEVTRMAEMEHGRWNAERLVAGWRFGPENDPDKKTNPYIVPWSALPSAIRKYDLSAVRNFPAVLARAGYKVYRPKP
jgi:ppGpp synthetase/RelA/SpoT-type nucleotidyltranferase